MVEQPIERRNLAIRDVDVATWAVLTAEADRRRWRMSAVLEHIVREWLAGREARHASEGSTNGGSSAMPPAEEPGADGRARTAVRPELYVPQEAPSIVRMT